MENRSERAAKRKQLRKRVLLLCFGLILIDLFVMFYVRRDQPRPNELLITYMNGISGQKYEDMYEMIDVEKSGNITRETFIERNSEIYEGIDIRNVKVKVLEYNRIQNLVKYQMSFDTMAGAVSFENEAFFTH